MTFGNQLDALVARADGPLVAGRPHDLPPTRLGDELHRLLRTVNGFVAFDAALVVRGSGEARGSLAAWNSPRGWRTAYGDLAAELFFFAQDVFGHQYALTADEVVEFDPETGDSRPIASTLNGWATWVLEDVDVHVGWSMARAWADLHGPLRLTERLVPTVPFVLGGAYTVENLRAADDEASMRARGGLAQQIARVPDGTSLHVCVTE